MADFTIESQFSAIRALSLLLMRLDQIGICGNL
jgi:hypothetical protein